MPTDEKTPVFGEGVSEEQWQAFLEEGDPGGEPDTPPPETDDNEPPPAQSETENTPPPGFTAEEWGQLPAETQQRLAQTIEGVEQRAREQLDRLAARHEDLQASYTQTMRSFKELSEAFGHHEEPAAKEPEPPKMPDPADVDWSDGRALAKYTQEVARAVAAETEARLKAELLGKVEETKAEAKAELEQRQRQEEQTRAIRAIEEFKNTHPDMEKYRAAMTTFILQGEREEALQKGLGKPVPFKSDMQKLEEAYREAVAMEEFKNYKRQKGQAKASPTPTGTGAARGTTKPPSNKGRMSIAESFDAAVAAYERATGKKLAF